VLHNGSTALLRDRKEMAMASKPGDGDYTLSISGPGHKFERKVAEDVASKVIAFVMGGGTAALESGGGTGSDHGGGRPGSTPSGGDKLTPKQFLAQKKPGSNYERVACLAYYLSNYRDTPHFKTSDINKLNTESAHHFTNAALFVTHATSSYHYLAAAGGGKKQITPLGEAIVEALPDRAAVSAAIAENKPTRKRAKRKKAKK
jgi:hypothetical protein